MTAANQVRDPTLGRLARRAGLWSLGFLLLVVFMLKVVDLEVSAVALQRLTIQLIGIVALLSLVNYVLRALRWQYLCRRIEVDVPLSLNSLYYVAGFAFTVTPGKIGEVVRLWFLKRRHGYDYMRTAGLLILDRLTDAWPLLIFALVGVAQFAGHRISLTIVAVVLALGSFVLLHPNWIRWGIKAAYARTRRAPRMFARALRLARMLGRLGRPSLLVVPFLLGLMGWFAEILGAWLILEGVGAPLDLSTVAFVFGFSMLVGALPIFPGGIGGAEATMTGLLGWLGVPLATAVAATAIIRLATLGLAVLIGFAALPFAAAASRPPHTAPALA